MYFVLPVHKGQLTSRFGAISDYRSKNMRCVRCEMLLVNSKVGEIHIVFSYRKRKHYCIDCLRSYCFRKFGVTQNQINEFLGDSKIKCTVKN